MPRAGNPIVKPKSAGAKVTGLPKAKVRPGSGKVGVGKKTSGTIRKSEPDARAFVGKKAKPKVKVAGIDAPNIGKGIVRTTAPPVLKALDLSTRPLHAVAGAERALIKARPASGLTVGEVKKVVREGKKGLTGKTHYGTADVLQAAGLKNRKVASVLGLPGDIVGDPLTYVTLGGGTLATHASTAVAQSAAQRAVKRAAKAGLSASQQERFGRMAARQAAKAPVKGVEGHIKFAGKTVARAKVRTDSVTGLASKPSKVAAKTRRVVHNVRPTVRPSATIDPGEHRAVLAVQREQRAIQNKGIADARNRARTIASEIPAEHHAAVIRAIETRQIGSLPEDLRAPARQLRDSYRHHARLRRQAGVSQGHIGDYFPHMRESAIRSGEANTEAEALLSATSRKSAVGSTKKRTLREPLDEANARVKRGNEFSSDIPAVHANYEVQTARLLATSHAGAEARNLGRPLVSKNPGGIGPAGRRPLTAVLVKTHAARDESIIHVGANNRVVLVTPQNASSMPKGGSYRIVNSATAKALTEPVAQKSHAFARRVVHPWKAIATATPAFHVRNAIGDSERAFSAGVPARRIPRLFKDAGSTLRYMHGEAGKFTPGAEGAVVNLGKSGSKSMREWVRELQHNGIINPGVRGSELQHIAGDRAVIKASEGKFRRTLGKGGQLLRDRENITYIATYKHFREAGLSEREAARKTMDALIDYGEVTHVEQFLRNTAVPFYTFQARVVPFYAKTFLQRPGKIAAFQKLRENAARFWGMDWQDLQSESEYKARQAGIPIGGKWVSAGLPIAQGLNQAAALVALKPTDAAVEEARYIVGSLAPWLKAPAELGPIPLAQQGGVNYFFESPIENPGHRLVVAPGMPWGKMSQGLRDRLGVVRIEDRRTGQIVWGWRGWKQYLVNAVTPGAPGFAMRVGQPTTQRGQNTGQQVLGFLTGIKVDNPDPIGAAINRSYAELNVTSAAKSDLNQQGKKDSPEYKALAAQERRLKAFIGMLSKARGDLHPLQQRTKKTNTDPWGVGGTQDVSISTGDPWGVNGGK